MNGIFIISVNRSFIYIIIIQISFLVISGIIRPFVEPVVRFVEFNRKSVFDLLLNSTVYSFLYILLQSNRNRLSFSILIAVVTPYFLCSEILIIRFSDKLNSLPRSAQITSAQARLLLRWTQNKSALQRRFCLPRQHLLNAQNRLPQIQTEGVFASATKKAQPIYFTTGRARCHLLVSPMFTDCYRSVLDILSEI